MTERKLKNILYHIGAKAYPSGYIKNFSAHLELSSLRRGVFYEPKSSSISICGPVRTSSVVLIGALHGLAHHLSYCKRNSLEHDEAFWETLYDLACSAVSISYLNIEEARNTDRSGIIKEIEKRMGTIYSAQYPSVSKDRYCTINVKSYKAKRYLQENNYEYSVWEKSWEKDLKRDDLDDEKENIIKRDESAFIRISDVTDLSIDFIISIALQGNTYSRRGDLKRHSYFYQNGIWLKKIPLSQFSKECEFLDTLQGVKIKTYIEGKDSI